MTHIDATRFYRDAARFAGNDEDMFTAIVNKFENIASHDLELAIDIMNNQPIKDFVREYDLENDQQWRYVR